MGKAIILQAIPGVPKTVYAEDVYRDALHVSADHFFRDAEGNYRWDPKKLTKAHGQCLRRFIQHITFAEPETMKDVVVDNTNVERWEMSPYVNVAKAYGWEVKIVTFEMDPDDAFEKCKLGIPLEVIERADERLEYPLRWWGKHTIFRWEDGDWKKRTRKEMEDAG